jgi:hypothetical protein
MTRQQAVFDFGRAHVIADHIWNLPASVCGLRRSDFPSPLRPTLERM